MGNAFTDEGRTDLDVTFARITQVIELPIGWANREGFGLEVFLVARACAECLSATPSRGKFEAGDSSERKRVDELRIALAEPVVAERIALAKLPGCAPN